MYKDLKIITLNEKISENFYSLAAEYLPGSDRQKMKIQQEIYPQTFLAAVSGNEITGICFGWKRPLNDGSFVLDGIAVKEPFQKNGIGKRLIEHFEKAAENYGASFISIGSAGGYVEKFYMECGYNPKEYKVWENGSAVTEKVFENTEEYRLYKRKNNDGFIVMEKILQNKER